MPNLTLSVTTEQAARLSGAFKQHYVGTALANAPLGTQAEDFIKSALRALVMDRERTVAISAASGKVTDLF